MLLLVFAPGAMHNAFVEPLRQQKLKERMQRNLRLAGVFDKTPTIVLVALFGAVVVGTVVISVFVGNIIFGFIASVILVPAAASWSLMTRQRNFMNRAADEISPFLNRVASATKAGRPVQSAYIQAVD